MKKCKQLIVLLLIVIGLWYLIPSRQGGVKRSQPTATVQEFNHVISKNKSSSKSFINPRGISNNRSHHQKLQLTMRKPKILVDHKIKNAVQDKKKRFQALIRNMQLVTEKKIKKLTKQFAYRPVLPKIWNQYAPGQNGTGISAIPPRFKKIHNELFRYYGFNAWASRQIPVNRLIPDSRPKR